jgi:hypothetical protein
MRDFAGRSLQSRRSEPFPADPNCPQASTTRAAIASSVSRPQRTRVIRLLIAYAAVHLQDAVVVGEHMAGGHPVECVLRVGIDVHLDHAVGDRFPDLIGPRGRAAVEHLAESALRDRTRRALPDRRQTPWGGAGRCPGGTPRERCRTSRPAGSPFARPEHFRHSHEVRGGGVQPLARSPSPDRSPKTSG